MADVEVALPDRIDSEIDRLVEQGEFINREQAIEELLTMGVSAYATTGSSDDRSGEFFTQVTDDQQDPALHGEGEDDEFPL